MSENLLHQRWIEAGHCPEIHPQRKVWCSRASEHDGKHFAALLLEPGERRFIGVRPGIAWD